MRHDEHRRRARTPADAAGRTERGAGSTSWVRRAATCHGLTAHLAPGRPSCGDRRRRKRASPRARARRTRRLARRSTDRGDLALDGRRPTRDRRPRSVNRAPGVPSAERHRRRARPRRSAARTTASSSLVDHLARQRCPRRRATAPQSTHRQRAVAAGEAHERTALGGAGVGRLPARERLHLRPRPGNPTGGPAGRASAAATTNPPTVVSTMTAEHGERWAATVRSRALEPRRFVRDGAGASADVTVDRLVHGEQLR